MAITFRADKNQITNKVLKIMKNRGFVDICAYFDRDSTVRKQVAYSDWDFMGCLSKFCDLESVDYAVEMLKNIKVIDNNAIYNKREFEYLRKEVKGINSGLQGRSSSFEGGKFKIPWTTISPMMERILYMLSSVRKPKVIAGRYPIY